VWFELLRVVCPEQRATSKHADVKESDAFDLWQRIDSKCFEFLYSRMSFSRQPSLFLSEILVSMEAVGRMK
jgi:hypothetical protein